MMNLTGVENSTEPVHREESMKYIAHEIIFLICCTVAFFADVAITFTTLYFKQMRIAPNILIANWAVTDLCSMLVTPSGYRLVSILDNFDLPSHFMRTLLHIGLTLHYITIVSVLIVLMDWFVTAYFSKFSKRIRVYYKFVVAFIWVTLLIWLIVLCTQDVSPKFHRTTINACFMTVFALLICIIIIRFINMLKKRSGRPVEHPKLALNLCTGFVMCYVLAIANFLLVELFRARHPLFQVISNCAIFCNSLVTFGLLYFCDKSFQAHLRRSFQCKFRRNGNSFSDSETLEADPFSEVSFHCPTEQLLTNN
ncbi:hypothetical protein RI129_006670 [Pyrocoelia pectoralis]|uniref:Uncharacterized protein n=1 Tax=Pyrocoelia pectoralis TaxID=417401 RepID=A0AAN7VB63_9COLE